MLNDLDSTLESILRKEGKIGANDVDVAFDQPTRDWSARINRPTINLWAYDVRENIKLRHTSQDFRMDVVNNIASRQRLPSRVDVTYLVTAWARKPSDEHQLLWRALATFKQLSQLEPRRCEGQLKNQSRELPLQVADMTEVKNNLSDLWSVLDNQMRLGFVMIVTLELDFLNVIEAPLVLEATFRIGQAEQPRYRELTTPDRPDVVITAKNKKKEGNNTE